MTVVEPSVSTAGSLRTSAAAAGHAQHAKRSESATVTTAGSPSGTAAAARLTEVINNSKGSSAQQPQPEEQRDDA